MNKADMLVVEVGQPQGVADKLDKKDHRKWRYDGWYATWGGCAAGLVMMSYVLHA